MDPENVRTIVQGAVTIVAAVVPASLVFAQNRHANARAAAERHEMRAIEEAKAEREAAAQLEVARSERLEGETARLLRFWVIADRVSSTLFARSSGDQSLPVIRPDDRAEISAAYADLMFSAPRNVRTLTEQIRKMLEGMIVSCSEFGGPPDHGEEIRLQSLLEQYRRSVVAPNDVEHPNQDVQT